ncbi:MAG TPA: hypothetical protein DDX98_06515 [Bacteroidales bacterium]|jgi:hypothetical protein|nr:hypothetical protein [Bacteroidales bacterium]
MLFQINHITHKNIDKAAYDKCIADAPNRLVYAFSWYLDIVSPNWNALIVNDYEAVMPLPFKSKLGLRHLYQPWFSQQLGVFGKVHDIDSNSLFNLLKKHYLFGHFSMNASNDFRFQHAKEKQRLNLLLDLKRSYAQIQQSYSKNHLRNIEKANSAELNLTHDLSVESFITLYQESDLQKKVGWTKKHIKQLQQLILKAEELNKGILIGVEHNNALIAATFVLIDEKRISYLFPITLEKGYALGAQFFLIDALFKEHAPTEKVFDFEGSSVEGIARFYRGFGVRQEIFNQISFGFRLNKTIQL